MATKGKKKQAPKIVPEGRVYVTATFNNTIVTITDNVGKVIAWGTAGAAGFKGARKSTPFAATTAVEQAVTRAKAMGLRLVEVYIKGPGSGRDAAIRALRSGGIDISMIADVTPIPHNGVRPKKRRRV